MAVNLSPYGGVGAQFFDNAGNVLTGGKIHTYLAGTTTNQSTYTTSVGNIFHSNPIILDASGRVPSGGEIWLTDGILYKFILRDSNDVLIATYDNISGINSNFVAYTSQQEIQTATAGQTIFNLTTMQYQPATNNLSVFVDGVNQYGPGAQYAFVETDSSTVTFVNGLHVGALVKFSTASPVASNVTSAENVSYAPPFTNSVTTNVEAKLGQIISVKDFGAVGNGVVDDTLSIQEAIDYAGSVKKSVYLPAGKYRITASLTADWPLVMYGDGGQIFSNPTVANVSNTINGSVIVSEVTTDYALKVSPAVFTNGMSLRNFSIVGFDTNTAFGGLYVHNIGWTGVAENMTLDNFVGSALEIDYIQDTHFINVACIRSGSTAASPILKISADSNYVYFLNSHIEDGNYLMLSDGGAFEVHFTNCHFEVGDYNGALGPAYDHSYSVPTMQTTSNEYNWTYTDCTFVPVSVDALVTANGGDRASQPYFFVGSANNVRFQFKGCRWIAPFNAIDIIQMPGNYNRHQMIDCTFQDVNPAKSAISFGDCTFIGNIIGYYEGWNIAKLDGVTINRGQIASCTFANNGGGTLKTSGYLIFSNIDNTLLLSNNRYDMGTSPFKWANSFVNLSSEIESLGWYIYSAGSINMELVPIGYDLRTNTAGLTVTTIANCQRGRRVRIFNDSGSGTINFVAGVVYPKTANNLSMAANSQYLFIADNSGMLIQVAS